MFALGSSVALGLQLFFMAPASRVNGWFYTSVFLRIAVAAYAGISVIISKQTKALFHWKTLPWKLILGIGVVDFIGLSVYSITVTKYAVSYVSIIVSCASLVTVLIARVWLRENLRPLQYAGIVLMILGIISLQMG
jgi:drug/metabolite transporter (DMT)-like permease